MTDANAGLVAPSDLQATPFSSGSLSLSWSDNSANETGFRIGRSLDGVTFVSIDITDATSYVDTGLAARTTYYYRIAATSSDGKSEYSNTASATTSSSCGCLTFEGLRGSCR